MKPDSNAVPRARPFGAEEPSGNPLGDWWLHALNGGTGLFNTAFRVSIGGRIDPAALEAAFRAVLARHEVLCTSYLELGGRVLPRLAPASQFQLMTHDLSALAPDMAAATLARERAVGPARPFDLSSGYALRADLLVGSPSDACLLVVAAGTACDATSLRLILHQVGERLAGRDPGPAAAFGDFARWYLDYLRGPGMRDDLAAIARLLQGAPPGSLLQDRPDGHDSALGPARAELELPEALGDMLQQLDPRHLRAVGVAAVACLQHRFTGAEDVLVGLQASLRRPGADDGVIGAFGNPVVVRLWPSGADPLSVIAGAAAAAIDAVSSGRHVPFHLVIDTLNARGDLPWGSALPAQFELEDAIPSGRWGIADPIPTGLHGRLQFCLRRPAAGPAVLACTYRPESFDLASVQGFLAACAILLQALVASPERKLADIDLVDAGGRHHLLFDLNDTDAPTPALAASEMVDAQALRTPDATAVICGEAVLTYRALIEQANSLARMLMAAGVAQGDRVAILLARSAAIPVALLAVLKAGAAYLPLDPDYPADRLAFMLGESGVKIVITDQALADGLAPPGARVVSLADPGWQAFSSAPVQVAVQPRDAAYIIYTSGSTGRPKGAQLPHGGLTNLLCSVRVRPGIAQTDTLLAATTFAFDFATLDMLLPLVAGARLVIARQHEVADGAALLALLRLHQVTMMQGTPTRWRMLIEAGWNGEPRLRMVAGGEKLDRRLADQMLARGEPWNIYGPTETTVYSTAERVTPGVDDVPIGTPIANTRLYVLDAQAALLPRGAIGELHIGGPGVGLGYLGQQALTAERFRPDPFRPDPFRPGDGGAMMYRTGDLVRWLASGTLEYRGRADHQLKLRGFRIEPGEVEVALQRHPAVRQSVVMLRVAASGEDMLVGYVEALDVPESEQPALAADLTTMIGRSLPHFMVPQAIVVMARFPISPNGKIDRAALPPPPVVTRAGAEQARQALSPTQARLADIWRSLLGVEDVRVDDNFFALGGTSLIAARLLARLNVAFGRKLGLAELHGANTLRELASRLDDAKAPAIAAAAAPVQVVHLQREGAEPPIFAINNTTIFYPLAARLGRQRPFVTLEIRKRQTLDEARPPTLADFADIYLREIRRLRPGGPYVLFGWCAGGVIAYDIARKLIALGEAVPLLVMVDAESPNLGADVPPWQRRLGRMEYLGQRAIGRGRGLIGRRGASDAATLGFSRAAVTSTPSTARGAGERARLERQRQEERALGVVDAQLVKQIDKAFHAYEPAAYQGDVLLFQPRDRPSGLFIDPSAGWRSLVKGELRIVPVPGTHTSLFSPEPVEIMSRSITQMLGRPALSSRAG